MSCYHIYSNSILLVRVGSTAMNYYMDTMVWMSTRKGLTCQNTTTLLVRNGWQNNRYSAKGPSKVINIFTRMLKAYKLRPTHPPFGCMLFFNMVCQRKHRKTLVVCYGSFASDPPTHLYAFSIRVKLLITLDGPLTT